MDSNILIERTVEYVKQALGGESSGHDWWHTYRVWSVAKTIAEHEGGNLLIIELAALLHDIADWKNHGGNLEVGPKKAREWLEKINVDEEIINEICNIIGKISFKGTNIDDDKELNLEGKIVQDADRLDAMGAVGIARTFAYGGAKGRVMYDPNIKPVQHNTVESYLNNQNPSINHFYEKLLLLKDRMNTDYAKKMANHRHLFMEQFLEEFYAGWDGKR